MIFGDWGLGIGDWAIPNPQSPIPKYYYLRTNVIIFKNNTNIILRTFNKLLNK